MPLPLPPPFVPVVLDGDRPALAEALARAAARPEHARLSWCPRLDRLDAALVLVPERDREAALAFVDPALLALYRAVAACLPPGVPLHLHPPRALLLDGAYLCELAVVAADGSRPAWLALGLDVPLRGPPSAVTLAGAGAEGVEASALLTAFCRHLLPLADAFETDGVGAFAGHLRAITLDRPGPLP